MKSPLIKIDSSSIYAVCHDPIKKELEVHWAAGGIGIYDNVDSTIYTRLLNSSSKGTFIAEELKKNTKKYPYRKMADGLSLYSNKQPASQVSEISKEQAKGMIKEHISGIEKVSRNFHKIQREELKKAKK